MMSSELREAAVSPAAEGAAPGQEDVCDANAESAPSAEAEATADLATSDQPPEELDAERHSSSGDSERLGSTPEQQPGEGRDPSSGEVALVDLPNAIIASDNAHPGMRKTASLDDFRSTEAQHSEMQQQRRVAGGVRWSGDDDSMEDDDARTEREGVAGSNYVTASDKIGGARAPSPLKQVHITFPRDGCDGDDGDTDDIMDYLEDGVAAMTSDAGCGVHYPTAADGRMSSRVSNAFPIRCRPVTHFSTVRTMSGVSRHVVSRASAASSSAAVRLGGFAFGLDGGEVSSLILPHRKVEIVDDDAGNEVSLRHCMESRPPLSRDLVGPTPCTYSPSPAPPHHRHAPAYTIGRRPKEPKPKNQGRETADDSIPQGISNLNSGSKKQANHRPPTGHPGVKRKRPGEASRATAAKSNEQPRTTGAAAAAAAATGGNRHHNPAPGQAPANAAADGQKPQHRVLGTNWHLSQPKLVQTQQVDFPGPGVYSPWYGAVTRTAPRISLYRRPRETYTALDRKGVVPPPNQYRPLVDYVKPRGPSYTISSVPRSNSRQPNRTL